MAHATGTKINRLLQRWPPGTVATQVWLAEQGVSSDLARWYVKAGWLTRVGQGAFVRKGDHVDWRGALYALQSQLGLSLHVGARTALELHGRAHFVPLGSRLRVTLISDNQEHLPAWFTRHHWEARIEHHRLTLFDQIPADATRHLDCGSFRIAASAPERAIMEEMCLARTNDDIDHSIQLMETLGTLRPQLVQLLLEQCTSVKVKRLFLWSAEHVGHAWAERLDSKRVDLGCGKRQLYKGGSLDPKYEITVPQPEELPDV